MKKLKIFLGAYVNFPNAQNINCDNIAKNLDKEKFEVHLMYCRRFKFCKTQYPIDKQWYKEHDIHLHCMIMHRFLWYWSKFFVMLFGNYDIYYLPKCEPMDKLIAKVLSHKKHVFISSVEGVITETVNNTAESREYYFDLMDDTFAISNCVADSIKKQWNCETRVLPLGVCSRANNIEAKDTVKQIIWVGNIKANKRPMFLLECAEAFPDLSFVMIGDGNMMDAVERKISEKQLANVQLTGRIGNKFVYEHMMQSDLLLMTSENEGLPKVIQEAAQCGLPAIYMANNYNVDFINNGVNGYEAYSVEEMKQKIQYLLDNPDVFSAMSAKAYETIHNYTWDVVIKDYEKYFIDLYNKAQ